MVSLYSQQTPSHIKNDLLHSELGIPLVETLSGKTFEVQVRQGARWETIEVHQARTPAIEKAEELVDTGNYAAVQVLSDSERSGTEVIFEKNVEAADRPLVKLVALDSAAVCDKIEDYYRLDARKTLGKILRNHLDRVGISALEFLFDRTEMNLLERNETLFPQFMQIAASAQAKKLGVKSTERAEVLYAAVGQIKDRALQYGNDEKALSILKDKGIDALLRFVPSQGTTVQSYVYSRFALASLLAHGGDWNSKIEIMVELGAVDISPDGIACIDEVLAELLDGAAAVGELLGGQADAFSANRSLIQLAEGSHEPPPHPISCIVAFNDLMGRYRLPLTREVLFDRVGKYLAGTRNLTREGPRAERDAFINLVRILGDVTGFKGGATISSGITQRARIALADGDDLSFEEALSKVIVLLPSRAARLGHLLELLQSDIGKRNESAVLVVMGHVVGQMKSLSSLMPEGASDEEIQQAVIGLKEKFNSEGLPIAWRQTLTQTFDSLMAGPKTQTNSQNSYRPQTEEYKNMVKKSPERKSIDQNQVLFNEGDSGSEAYLILSGEVEIFRQQGNHEEIIAKVGRGDIIGEMSLIDNQPRMASARVLEGGKVTIIDQDNFSARLDNLEKNDRVLRRLIDVLVNRMRGEGRAIT